MRLVFVPLVLLTIVPFPVSMAQCVDEELQRLEALDGVAGARFGKSVSLQGDTLVIGARNDDQGLFDDSGAAYVFVRSSGSWSQDTKLVASDRASDDHFGQSVSLDGDVIVVGARLDDHSGATDAGSAYVFRLSGGVWQEEAKLIAPSPADNDWFGTNTSVYGDVIVVGARLDDHSSETDAGSAYVFRYNGSSWTFEQQLTASDADSQDLFGRAVTVEGTTIVIGASGDEGGRGSVYVFDHDGSQWNETQKLESSDGAAGDSFGHSVSLDGNRMAIGAREAEVGGTFNAGAAYTFFFDGAIWEEEQRLVAHDAAPEDWFGQSVSLQGDRVAVGARLRDTGINKDVGAAYVFAHDGGSFVQEAQLLASDGIDDEEFGRSVSLDGDSLAVGAWRKDLAAPNSGAVYVYASGSSRLLLSAEPSAPSSGDTLTFLSRWGNPDDTILLVLEELQGLPTFTILLSGTIDAQSQLEFGAVVPPGVGGVTAQFVTYGISRCGQVVKSSSAEVQFQ